MAAYIEMLCKSRSSAGGGGWIRALCPVFLRGRDHGNEMIDETAIQLRLNQELNPGPSGWKLRVLQLS